MSTVAADAGLALAPAPGGGSRRLRLAWVEEWMSVLAERVLPYLARHHDVTYVTAGDAIPNAAFELSHRVNQLHRDGLIDLALVWASIGFGLSRVPFINLEGTSVYAEIELFASALPAWRRLRFLPGLVHYALPEMVCNRRALCTIVPTEALRRDEIGRAHV